MVIVRKQLIKSTRYISIILDSPIIKNIAIFLQMIFLLMNVLALFLIRDSSKEKNRSTKIKMISAQIKPSAPPKKIDSKLVAL